MDIARQDHPDAPGIDGPNTEEHLGEMQQDHRDADVDSNVEHLVRVPQDYRGAGEEHPLLDPNKDVASAVTRLLLSMKDLPESLTQWSKAIADWKQVSDVYVRLVADFLFVVGAFEAFGIDMRYVLAPIIPLICVIYTSYPPVSSPLSLKTSAPSSMIFSQWAQPPRTSRSTSPKWARFLLASAEACVENNPYLAVIKRTSMVLTATVVPLVLTARGTTSHAPLRVGRMVLLHAARPYPVPLRASPPNLNMSFRPYRMNQNRLSVASHPWAHPPTPTPDHHVPPHPLTRALH